jgi:anti-sigma-K factor RskA
VSTDDRFRDDVGAYLLGALDRDDMAAFEDHLSGCQACREEVERLALARDALPRSVDQLAPPPQLKATLMERVRAEASAGAEAAPGRARRSRWRGLLLSRPRFAAAAAVVVLAVGIAAGALVGAIGGDGGDERTVAAIVDGTRMPKGTGSLVIPGSDGGAAQLRVEGMQQPPAGRVYEVWIKRGSQVTPSSLFTVGSDGSGTAAIPDDLAGAEAVMVTREREGGTKAPSEPPVITIPVSS